MSEAGDKLMNGQDVLVFGRIERRMDESDNPNYSVEIPESGYKHWRRVVINSEFIHRVSELAAQELPQQAAPPHPVMTGGTMTCQCHQCTQARAASPTQQAAPRTPLASELPGFDRWWISDFTSTEDLEGFDIHQIASIAGMCKRAWLAASATSVQGEGTRRLAQQVLTWAKCMTQNNIWALRNEVMELCEQALAASPTVTPQWDLSDYDADTVEVTGEKEQHIAFFPNTVEGKSNARLLIRAASPTVTTTPDDMVVTGSNLEGQGALREALEAWEHWYSVDSTEFNRDTAREMGLRALGKRK